MATFEELIRDWPGLGAPHLRDNAMLYVEEDSSAVVGVNPLFGSLHEARFPDSEKGICYIIGLAAAGAKPALPNFDPRTRITITSIRVNTPQTNFDDAVRALLSYCIDNKYKAALATSSLTVLGTNLLEY